MRKDECADEVKEAPPEIETAGEVLDRVETMVDGTGDRDVVAAVAVAEAAVKIATTRRKRRPRRMVDDGPEVEGMVKITFDLNTHITVSG